MRLGSSLPRPAWGVQVPSLAARPLCPGCHGGYRYQPCGQPLRPQPNSYPAGWGVLVHPRALCAFPCTDVSTVQALPLGAVSRYIPCPGYAPGHVRLMFSHPRGLALLHTSFDTCTQPSSPELCAFPCTDVGTAQALPLGCCFSLHTLPWVRARACKIDVQPPEGTSPTAYVFRCLVLSPAALGGPLLFDALMPGTFGHCS